MTVFSKLAHSANVLYKQISVFDFEQTNVV